ncbi:superoxide dismutase family protein [Deinococcus sp.]|uniref:superoxide dismutase family protein n=1 Tax=Deinococcus sp. TaxID=47478 RepID=UPI003CC61DE2
MKALIVCGLLLGSAASAQSATAILKDAQGANIGSVHFDVVRGGVQVSVQAHGLTPGGHGMHVHENGSCEVGVDAMDNMPKPFFASGEHFDPALSKQHATPTTPDKLGHAGDLPMLMADASGNATLSFTSSKLSLSGMASLLRRSVIVHAKPDDYKTNPAGMTGERVACGVIVRDDSAARVYQVPGTITFPEGVAVSADQSTIFTGSSRTGTIYAIDAASGEARIFSPGGSLGRTSALGLKLDARGRLYVAGGATGAVSVLNPDGSPLTTLMTPPSPTAYINDLVLGPDGSAYVTDSSRPVIWRVTPDLKRIEAWLPLQGTQIKYQPGINLNGIALTPDGKALLTVQYNTGKLFRIDLASRRIQEVSVPGGLMYGDGLLLDGNTLYVGQNKLNWVRKVELAAGAMSGKSDTVSSADGLKYPSTLALLGGDLIAVNSELDRTTSGTPPEVPFKLSRFPKF